MMSTGKKDRNRKVLHTFLTTVVILAFLTALRLSSLFIDAEGVAGTLLKGCVIWIPVIGAVAYYFIRYRSLVPIGLTRSEQGTPARVMFYIPFIAAAALNFAGGLSGTGNAGLIAAELFLSLGTGFAEEIYFRGIICSIWAKSNVKKAVIISSLIYAACHLLGLLDGFGPVEATLHVCFAFVYGAATALEYIIGGSIFPCVILHALNDFSLLVTSHTDGWLEIVIDVLQIIIFVIFVVYCTKKQSGHLKHRAFEQYKVLKIIRNKSKKSSDRPER